MLGISQAFQDAVKTTHDAVAKLNILHNGKVIAADVPIFDGSVSADATAAQRRTFTASIPAEFDDLIPTDKRSTLAPFGNQAQVFRGVQVPTVTLIDDRDDTAATWAEGTHNGTAVDPVTGDLILGFQS